MMEKDTTNEPLFRERSYVKSIGEGCRLLLRHPWCFMSLLLTILPITLLAYALASHVLTPMLGQVFASAFQAGIVPATLITRPLLYVLLYGVLAVLLLGMQVGQVSYLMHKYGELDYVPVHRTWKLSAAITKEMMRGMLLCVVGYVVVGGMLLLSLYVMPTRLWALVLFVVLTLVWVLYYVSVGQQFMLSQRSFAASLVYPIRHFGDLGGIAAILVVCGIVVLTVMEVGALPAICTVYVSCISDASVAMGDGTDIPASFPWLRDLSFALVSLVMFVAWNFLLVPLAFHWGSLEHSRANQDATA